MNSRVGVRRPLIGLTLCALGRSDMGGFNSAFRIAADPTLPMGVRYVMFIQTCSAFGGLARSGLQPVYDALGQRFGFSRDDKPDGSQLTLALNAMVQVRFRLLHMLAQCRTERRRRKAHSDQRKLPAPFTTGEVLQMLRSSGHPAGT
ncbi:MAG: hypothetical protein M3Q13_04125 [Pseudomonadota bacterium]|nr:hypothetical protein [Pseudomonadota bacterium]